MFTVMAEQFPDFDQTTLPTIPHDWLDTSWHNDACPSFIGYQNEDGLTVRVFIDYADRAMSEFPQNERFSIIVYNCIDGTDIASHQFACFSDVLAAIEEIDANA